MKSTKEQRQEQNFEINKKFIITLGILAFCVYAFSLVISFYLTRGEGDPYFVFIEVPANATMNSAVIHLEDKDILNVKGLDVKFENGKLTSIRFRQSAIHPLEFSDMYGSRAGDPSSRKYLEYKGVYYYGYLVIP